MPSVPSVAMKGMTLRRVGDSGAQGGSLCPVSWNGRWIPGGQRSQVGWQVPPGERATVTAAHASACVDRLVCRPARLVAEMGHQRHEYECRIEPGNGPWMAPY